LVCNTVFLLASCCCTFLLLVVANSICILLASRHLTVLSVSLLNTRKYKLRIRQKIRLFTMDELRLNFGNGVSTIWWLNRLT
jgi:hypothetical protein